MDDPARLIHPKAFLFTKARNAAVDLFRRRNVHPHESLSEADDLIALPLLDGSPAEPPAPLFYSDRAANGWELVGTFEVTKGFTIVGNYTNFTNGDPNNVPFRGTAEKSAAAWAR